MMVGKPMVEERFYQIRKKNKNFKIKQVHEQLTSEIDNLDSCFEVKYSTKVTLMVCHLLWTMTAFVLQVEAYSFAVGIKNNFSDI